VTRTLQDRLVNELRAAGITTVAAANRYLREPFLPAFNAEFGRPPTDPSSAFVPLGRVDLDQILCVEAERVVSRDNVVPADGVPLHVAKQPGRRTCAGLRVLVRRHLNGHHSLAYGTRCLGCYDHRGRPLLAPLTRAVISRCQTVAVKSRINNTDEARGPRADAVSSAPPSRRYRVELITAESGASRFVR